MNSEDIPNMIAGKLREDGGFDEFDIKAANAFVLNDIIKKI